MKKLLPFLSLFLLAAILCSCSLLPAPQDTEGVPALSAIEDAIRAAKPTESCVTITAAYDAPAVTLTAHITVKKNEAAAYYTYDAERLLSTEEALAAGSPIGVSEGHLQLEGNQVVDSSAEVDAELLAGVSSLSVNLPRLDAGYFSAYEIAEGNGGVTLTATVKDEKLADMLDETAEISGLSFTISLTAELTPTALVARWTSQSGAAVTYEAAYSYTPVTIP